MCIKNHKKQQKKGVCVENKGAKRSQGKRIATKCAICISKKPINKVHYEDEFS